MSVVFKDASDISCTRRGYGPGGYGGIGGIEGMGQVGYPPIYIPGYVDNVDMVCRSGSDGPGSSATVPGNSAQLAQSLFSRTSPHSIPPAQTRRSLNQPCGCVARRCPGARSTALIRQGSKGKERQGTYCVQYHQI